MTPGAASRSCVTGGKLMILVLFSLLAFSTQKANTLIVVLFSTVGSDTVTIIINTMHVFNKVSSVARKPRFNCCGWMVVQLQWMKFWIFSAGVTDSCTHNAGVCHSPPSYTAFSLFLSLSHTHTHTHLRLAMAKSASLPKTELWQGFGAMLSHWCRSK